MRKIKGKKQTKKEKKSGKPKGQELAITSGVWCCEKTWKCLWPSFVMHHGLAWGVIPVKGNPWRQEHDTVCGGRLIQLVEPKERSVQR